MPAMTFDRRRAAASSRRQHRRRRDGLHGPRRRLRLAGRRHRHRAHRAGLRWRGLRARQGERPALPAAGRPARAAAARARRGRRVREERRPRHHGRPGRRAACCCKRETIKHTYPFCWRCDTPLLYYAKPTWYIRTTAVKDSLIAGNEQINWYPEHIKHGRFGDWLRNNIDWALSRERYWGTPLPIWQCERLRRRHDCIGSRAELRDRAADPAGRRRAGRPPPPLHRPHRAAAARSAAARMKRVARGDGRLVRLRRHALRAVALPVREQGRRSSACSPPTTSARRSTRRAAGSTRCTPRPPCSTRRPAIVPDGRLPTGTSSASATSWTTRAAR